MVDEESKKLKNEVTIRSEAELGEAKSRKSGIKVKKVARFRVYFNINHAPCNW
jgi:hypothetical protein